MKKNKYKIKDVIDIIERRAPLKDMLEYDSAGLNLGDADGEVKGILLAQNPTYATIEECRSLCCNLLVTHHPSVFGEVDAYAQSLLDMAKAYGISLYSCHTNLDCCKGGLNDYVARFLGMQEVKIVDGCARAGVIEETDLLTFVRKVSKVLNDANVKYVGDADRKIKKVVLCTGAGARDEQLVEYARANGADCIVGGESKLSVALRVRDYSLALIDIGHFESEIFCVNIFKEWLKDFADVVHVSQTDVSPYHKTN